MKPAMLYFGWFLLMVFATTTSLAQEAEMTDDGAKPVRDMFDGIYIIDNQSVFVPVKGTFEFDILHRFGTVNGGYKNLYGLNLPANVRIAFGYVPIKNLMVGMGLTRTHMTWDLNAKYSIFRQSRSGSIPVSLSYFVNMAIDSRKKETFTNPVELEFADRVSYFHQLLVARKVSDKFSLQAGVSLSHFNTVEAELNDQDEIVQKWNNDHLALSFSGKYQLTTSTNIMVNYDQPLTTHDILDPQPNLSFGFEFTTSSHQFQVFLGNFYNITPQRNHVFNTNEIGEGQFLIGFNMTRLWNF